MTNRKIRLTNLIDQLEDFSGFYDQKYLNALRVISESERLNTSNDYLLYYTALSEFSATLVKRENLTDVLDNLLLQISDKLTEEQKDQIWPQLKNIK